MATLSLFHRRPEMLDELDEIETYAESFDVTAGSVVIKQGEPAGGFFVVLAGEFTAVLETGSRSVPLARLGPGTCFGATDLLLGRVHSTTVRATTDGEVVVLGERELRSILSDAATAGVDLPAAATAYVNLLDWDAGIS